MSEKKLGRMDYYNKYGKYGYLIDEDGKKIKVFEKNFLNSSPINKGKVYYQLNNQNRVDNIEVYYPYYFKEIVLDLEKHDYDEFCDQAKEYAKVLVDGDVSTSQIRKIYSQIYRAREIRDIKRLRPQFAYTAGRNRDVHRLRELMATLDYLAKHAESGTDREENHLKNIKTFLEAIVAYMKYVGDKDR